jgi:hypothetical protein
MTYLVIEESSWSVGADGDRQHYIERIEQWLERLDVAWERNEGVAASRELMHVAAFGGSVSDFLWGGGLPREVQERVVIHIGRIRWWDDEEDWTSLEARVASEDLDLVPSIAYVHQRVADGETLACLPLPGRWHGPTEVIVDERTETLHFVTDEETHRDYFRDAVARQKVNLTAVAELAPHAFPCICFCEHVWREARDFEGGYARVRLSLLQFLAAFDDHAYWVFTDESGRVGRDELTVSAGGVGVTRKLIEQRFYKLGFEVSPESPEIANNSSWRRAREREIQGSILYCEWHYKIEGHTNRVHFHGPVPASQDRPIIAIFTQHLPP